MQQQPVPLSASDIAEFTFCPEAWYLRRHGQPRSTAAAARLEAGTRARQQIGRATDQLRHLEYVRRLLVLAMLVILVLLLGTLPQLQSVVHP